MACYLYILQSEVKETYYTGISDSTDRRTFFHNVDRKGYTNRYRPWKLVFTKSFDSRQQALAAEQTIKKWKSKKMIRLLVNGKIHLND
jgi:putative endonuclease